MADNIPLNLGSGGSTLATHDNGTAQFQRILAANVASSDNTTTTPLSSGATYTGTADVAPADGVVVSCKTDNSGTLYFDFSNDGTNFDTFPSSGFVVSSGIHEYHSAKVNGRYFRVRLVNDSGAQSYLRLYTYFGPHTHPSAPVNQTLGADADSMVVRAYPQHISSALGRLGGVTGSGKFGYISGLANTIVIGTSSTWVDLWGAGGKRTSPTSSFTPYVASSSGSDTTDVVLEYLDASGNAQTTTVTLTGQTPVSAAVTATECTRAYNGGATDFVGDVYVTTANNFTSGVPDNQNEMLAKILANDGQTQVLAGRVPTGKVLIPDPEGGLRVSILRDNGSAGSMNAVFQVRESGGVWRTKRQILVTTSTEYYSSMAGITVPAAADWRVRIRDVSDSATYASGEFDYSIVDA